VGLHRASMRLPVYLIGAGGSNWSRTVTPDVAGVSVDPLAVVGTVEGPAGVAAPCLLGAVAGETVDGVGAVAAWLEQAVQSPNTITIAAFLIVASIRRVLNRQLRRSLQGAK
jgi:hypothetical protein